LGVQVVRLNSIFEAEHYPEVYSQVQNLTDISSVLGNMKDFSFAVNVLHKRNISVVLDLPLSPFIKQLSVSEKVMQKEIDTTAEKNTWLFSMDSTSDNETERKSNTEAPHGIKRIEAHSDNMVSAAISYWLKNGVDGIYLKGLEYLVDMPDFASLIQEWRRVTKSFNKGLDKEKIVMCSMDVLNALDLEDNSSKVDAVLNSMDLIDVSLDIVTNGTEGLKAQVDKVVKGVLFKKPGYPWIHWNIGNIDTRRVASHLPKGNATLAAVLFEMMLPGTPSIFYGDEIGLEEIKDPEGEVNYLHSFLLTLLFNYRVIHSCDRYIKN